MRSAAVHRAVVVVSILAMPAMARAQEHSSDSARATARALAREGYEAQKHGQYALAADRFQRAEELLDAPTLLLGLARAQVGMGKLVEADETYRRILREPLASGAPSPFVKAFEEATREAPAVAARRAWVTVAVAGPPAGQAHVAIDDAPVPEAAVGVRLACNPGAHVVKISASGFAPTERSFAIAEGGEQTLTVPMQALPPEPAPVVAQTPAPEPPLASAPVPIEPSRSSSSQKTWGYGALGVGIAGLVVGGAAGVFVLVRHGSLADSCPDGQCAADRSGALSTYRTLADVSTVATIVGAVGTVAGITILLTSPRPTTVGIYAAPTSAGIAGRF